uniref:Alpha-catulin n=1 Tax=Phallusia mammillata TaxID=59560 RepID=A0A6F9D9J8_9ASCI|nr:alpha-catulin [Phallusia mammillata]
MYHVCADKNNGQAVLRRDVFWQCMEKCMENIPTKSIENSVMPLAEQMAALLRHRGPASSMTSLTSPARALTTDQAVHVVSKAVTTFVRAGRVVANDNRSIQREMENACDDAIMAGESLCRVLTTRPSYSQQFGISPSTSSGTSQNGTDSGVDEDLDDDLSYEVFHLPASDAEPVPSIRISAARDISTNSMSLTQGQKSDKVTELLSASSSELTMSSVAGAFLRTSDSSSGSLVSSGSHSDEEINQSNLATSCYALLASVINVLSLADSILVEEIIQCKDEVYCQLDSLWKCDNFHEFLKQFTEFGTKMVKLAHFTGARQKDLKCEEAKTQMSIIRSVLERGTSALLATSKAWYHFPSTRSEAIRGCSFRRMKRALFRLQQISCRNTRWRQRNSTDLANKFAQLETDDFQPIPTSDSAALLIRRLQAKLRKSSSPPNSCHDLTEAKCAQQEENIEVLAKKVMECMDEFTDCPYTKHLQRMKIVSVVSMFKDSLDCCIKCGQQLQRQKLEDSTILFNKICKELTTTLHEIAVDQAADIIRVFTGHNDDTKDPATVLLMSLHHNAAAQSLDRFAEISSKASEACKLLGHCLYDPSHVTIAHHVTESLTEFSEQVKQSFLLATSLPKHRMVQETLSDVVQQWRSFVLNDLVQLCAHAQSEDYSSVTSNARRSNDSESDVIHDMSEQKTTAVRLGLEIKLLASQCRIEMQQLKRSDTTSVYTSLFRHVSEMIDVGWNIFLFTKGEPPLRTTVDFFKASDQIGLLSREIETDLKCVSEQKTESRSSNLVHKLHQAICLLSSTRDQLQMASHSSAHGKSAMLRKVMATLKGIRGNVEVVSKVLVEISASSLQNFCPQSTLRKQKPRSKSLTPRRSQTTVHPSSSNTCTTPTRSCVKFRSENSQIDDMTSTKRSSRKSSSFNGTKDGKLRKNSHSRGHVISTRL